MRGVDNARGTRDAPALCTFQRRTRLLGSAMAQTLENLDRRVTALERTQGETTETLRWVVTKLARMQAVQDEHTLRLERLETKVDGLEAKVDGLDLRLSRVEHKIDGLIEALPDLIADAVRSAR